MLIAMDVRWEPRGGQMRCLPFRSSGYKSEHISFFKSSLVEVYFLYHQRLSELGPLKNVQC